MGLIIKKQILLLTIILTFLGFNAVSADASSTYTVKRGDTLSKIARKSGENVKHIVEANKITNPNRIKVGQKLVLNKVITTKKSKKAVHKSAKKEAVSPTSSATVTKAQFRFRGVIYQNGRKWTYYTGSRFADGTSNHGGYDANGYLIVAAPRHVPFGTHVQTPLGEGVVHDRGTAIVGNHYDVVMP